jgi:hypothetical protein
VCERERERERESAQIPLVLKIKYEELLKKCLLLSCEINILGARLKVFTALNVDVEVLGVVMPQKVVVTGCWHPVTTLCGVTSQKTA